MPNERCKYQTEKDGHYNCSLIEEEYSYAYPCGYFLPIESCPTLKERKKIEKIVIEYLEKHKEEKVYPSDIAFVFNLNARKVFSVCQELKKEGRIV